MRISYNNKGTSYTGIIPGSSPGEGGSIPSVPIVPVPQKLIKKLKNKRVVEAEMQRGCANGGQKKEKK